MLSIKKLIPILFLVKFAASVVPTAGSYSVNSTRIDVATLDQSDPTLLVVYPEGNIGEKFPLLTFAHGFAGGSMQLYGYTALLEQVASWGFIIAAPFSCDIGCDNSKKNIWTTCAGEFDINQINAEGWKPYYGEMLKAIDFARNDSSVHPDGIFGSVDWSVGVGIMGHSMGGQAAVIASIAKCTKQYDIRASVLQHTGTGEIMTTGGGFYNIGANVSVPMLVMTSTGDEQMFAYSKDIYTAAVGAEHAFPTAYRNEVGWSHLEPFMEPPIENPLLATFTAAWFKVFLNGDKGAFYDAIFGAGPDSMCNHAPMKECWANDTTTRLWQ